MLAALLVLAAALFVLAPVIIPIITPASTRPAGRERST
jgi:hypothetical protein